MTSTADGQQGPIILFDGVCNLCTASVQFVIARDARRRFQFASLQSPVAERILGPDIESGGRLGSVVLVVGDKTYRRSSAALQTLWRLDGLWPLLAALLIVPRPIRAGSMTGSGTDATASSASATSAGCRMRS